MKSKLVKYTAQEWPHPSSERVAVAKMLETAARQSRAAAKHNGAHGFHDSALRDALAAEALEVAARWVRQSSGPGTASWTKQLARRRAVGPRKNLRGRKLGPTRGSLERVMARKRPAVRKSKLAPGETVLVPKAAREGA